jgi:lipid A 3-O-deacylase
VTPPGRGASTGAVPRLPVPPRVVPQLSLRRVLPLLAALLAAGVASPPPGRTQELRAVHLSLENDLFGVRGRGAPPDHDYTHGVRVAGEFAGPADDRSVTLGLGQEIYTPREDAPEPVPGERPYAAWLYLEAGVASDRGHRRDDLSVRVGVVGPPALGEPVQNGVHRLTGSRPQLGWGHQLGTRPGAVLRWERTHRLRPAPGARWLALLPGWSVAAGNVETGVGAGVRVRAGTGRGPHALLGARAEYGLRDLFLDAPESGVERIPAVAEWEAGAGWTFRRVEVEYRFVARGREYRTQAEPHRWGSLGVTWRPGRAP